MHAYFGGLSLHALGIPAAAGDSALVGAEIYTVATIVSIAVGLAALVLSGVTIWLALHFDRKSAVVLQHVRDSAEGISKDVQEIKAAVNQTMVVLDSQIRMVIEGLLSRGDTSRENRSRHQQVLKVPERRLVTVLSGPEAEVEKDGRWVPATACWRHPRWKRGDITGATWISSSQRVSEECAKKGGTIRMRHRFQLPDGTEIDRSLGKLFLAVDDVAKIYCNDVFFGERRGCGQVHAIDLGPGTLRTGMNELLIEVTNRPGGDRANPEGNPMGVVYRLELSLFVFEAVADSGTRG